MDNIENTEAEKAVLGSILIENSCFDKVAETVDAADFQNHSNRSVYSAMLDLRGNGYPIDIVTVSETLRKSNNGKYVQPDYLAGLLNAVPTSLHAVYYANIVRDNAVMARLAEAAQGMMNITTTKATPEEVVSKTQALLSKVPGKAIQDKEKSVAEIGYAFWESLDNPAQHALGLSTGLKQYDAVLGGLFPEELNLLAARPRTGKCLGYNTPIIMFDGSVKMVQDIIAGDVLMGPDSRPRNVLSTTVGIDEMYRVDQCNGDPYVVNSVHILSLIRNNEVVNIPVSEYIKKSEHWRLHTKGYKASVDWSERSVLIDSYVLGAWLSGAMVLVPVDVTTRDLVNNLEYYHLFKNKHIPDDYKFTSARIRRELLAGILDGDGYLSSKNFFEVTAKSRRFADDIVFLARSLGFAAVSIRSIEFPGLYWRIVISGDFTEIPFRVESRKVGLTRPKRSVLNTSITVTPLIGTGNYYGFTLDGDGLFLLGDFTVTHNTNLAVQMITNIAKSTVDFNGAVVPGNLVHFFSLEMPAVQVVQRIIANVGEINSHHLKVMQLTNKELESLPDAIGRLSDLNILIDDTPVDIYTLMNRVRRIKKERNTAVVFIDFLQLIKPEEGTKEPENMYIGRNGILLKELAKELKIPIVALTQLNRQIESRPGHEFLISDLGGSGKLEWMADTIIYMDRPEIWDPTTSETGILKLFVKKHRGGDEAELWFRAEPEYSRYTDIPVVSNNK